jgi:hypothetical protein
MTEGIPLGILILLVLAGLLLLTPGGRGLIWARWGSVEPKAQSRRTRSRRSRAARLGRPFGRGGEFKGFS